MRSRGIPVRPGAEVLVGRLFTEEWPTAVLVSVVSCVTSSMFLLVSRTYYKFNFNKERDFEKVIGAE